VVSPQHADVDYAFGNNFAGAIVRLGSADGTAPFSTLLVLKYYSATSITINGRTNTELAAIEDIMAPSRLTRKSGEKPAGENVLLSASGIIETIAAPPVKEFNSLQDSSSIIDQYPTTSIIFPDGAQLVMIGTLQIHLSFS
jgi:hypothetical protein